MINIINNKTLYDYQLELGVKEGLKEFASRCTGNSTGQALELIGQLMQAKQEVIDLKFSQPVVMQYIVERIEQMGLVGFIFQGTTLSYYPFKEHHHVETVIQEVKVQVSPYDGEALSPRGYNVVQHPERVAVRVPSLEESYGKVCQTFS